MNKILQSPLGLQSGVLNTYFTYFTLPRQLFLLTACKSLTLEELGQLARLLQLKLETRRLWTLFCFDVHPQILQAPIWRGGGGEKNKE